MTLRDIQKINPLKIIQEASKKQNESVKAFVNKKGKK